MRTIKEIDDHGVALSKPRVKFQKAVDGYRRMSAQLSMMKIHDHERSKYAHIMMKKKKLALRLAGGEEGFEEDTPAQKIQRYHYRVADLISDKPRQGRPRMDFKDRDDAPVNNVVPKPKPQSMPEPYEGELRGGLDSSGTGFPIAVTTPPEKFQHETAA